MPRFLRHPSREAIGGPVKYVVCEGVAGGRLAGHREVAIGASWTGAPGPRKSPLPWLSASQGIWRKGGRSRAARGERAWTMPASPRKHPYWDSPVRGRPATRDAPRPRHTGAVVARNTRCRKTGPHRRRRGRGAALGIALKGERLQCWRRQPSGIHHFFYMLAWKASFHWLYILLWVPVGRPGSANQMSRLACIGSGGPQPNRSRVLLHSLRGLECRMMSGIGREGPAGPVDSAGAGMRHKKRVVNPSDWE